jgi:uncharacterized low-complexity protein
MNNSNKSLAFAVAGAFALSVGATSIDAAENPFAIKSLGSGYQVADAASGKMKDGKCGTGKCGANKKKMMENAAAGKSKEGACNADKMKDGNCSAEMKKELQDKSAEGKCSADMKKSMDGKCSADMMEKK